MSKGLLNLLQNDQISKSPFFDNFHRIRSPFLVEGRFEPKVRRKSSTPPNSQSFGKMNIPTSSLLYPQPPFKRRGHRCPFIGCNPIHIRKSQLKWRIPTPLICPKLHSIPHPYLKANILSKILPTHADTSPQATPMNPST